MEFYNVNMTGPFMAEQVETLPEWTEDQTGRFVFALDVNRYYLGASSLDVGENGWTVIGIYDDSIKSMHIDWDEELSEDVEKIDSRNIPTLYKENISNVQLAISDISDDVNDLIHGNNFVNGAIKAQAIGFDANDILIENGSGSFIGSNITIEIALHQLFDRRANDVLLELNSSFGSRINVEVDDIQGALNGLENYVTNLDGYDITTIYPGNEQNITLQDNLNALYNSIDQLNFKDLIGTPSDYGVISQVLVTNGINQLNFEYLEAIKISCQYPSTSPSNVQAALWYIQSSIEALQSHAGTINASNVIYDDSPSSGFNNVDDVLDYLLTQSYSPSNPPPASIVSSTPIGTYTNVQDILLYFEGEMANIIGLIPSCVDAVDIMYNSQCGHSEVKSALDYLFINLFSTPCDLLLYTKTETDSLFYNKVYIDNLLFNNYYTIIQIDDMFEHNPGPSGGTGGTGTKGQTGGTGASGTSGVSGSGTIGGTGGTGASGASGVGSTGTETTDHGLLNATSLTHDDHTQYLLANGSRQLTNHWNTGPDKVISCDCLTSTDTSSWLGLYKNTVNAGTQAKDVTMLVRGQNAQHLYGPNGVDGVGRTQVADGYPYTNSSFYFSQYHVFLGAYQASGWIEPLLFVVMGDAQVKSLVQYSDERLKENIAPINLGLDFIDQLNPVSFKWKDDSPGDIKVIDVQETKERESIELIDGKYVKKIITETITKQEPILDEFDLYDETGTTIIGTHKISRKKTDEELESSVVPKQNIRTHFGLVAQEVKSLIDNLGIDSQNFAPYVYDEERDSHALRYQQFIPILIKAIQELKIKNTDLEDRINILENI